MTKKAANPAPEAPENSEEVVISTAPETEGTEATTSAAIDQPAVSDDASASPPFSAPEAPSSPAEEMQPGGGFSSPFVEPPAALTMVQRIEILEAKVAALEGN